MNRARILLAYFITSITIGCASTGSYTTSGQRIIDIQQVLSNGDIRLTCDTSCSGSWGAKRNEMKSLYENELWKDLASTVAGIGFRSDQTYFYLGRSAEGLGYEDAARTYYKLAKASYKCDSFPFNNCDGLVFPRQIDERLEKLGPPKAIYGNSKSKDEHMSLNDDHSETHGQLAETKQRLPAENGIEIAATASLPGTDASMQLRTQGKEAENISEEESSPKDNQNSPNISITSKKDIQQNSIVEQQNVQPRMANLEEKKAIVQGARNSLKDPLSAMFGEIVIIGNDRACADINAKNGFGGYTGMSARPMTKIQGSWYILPINTEISMDACIKVSQGT